MKIALRILVDIVLVIALLNGWWPVAVVCALIGSWLFRHFFEIILAGLAYDAIFGMVPGLGWKEYAGTITAVILFLAIRFLKKLVRM